MSEESLNIWRVIGLYSGRTTVVYVRCASKGGVKVFCGQNGMSGMHAEFVDTVPVDQTTFCGFPILVAEFESTQEAYDRQVAEAAHRRKRI